MNASITQREAGRLVREFTARTMVEILGQSKSLESVLSGRKRRLEDVSIVEFRNLLSAFEAEVETLEKRIHGRDAQPAQVKEGQP